MAARSNTLTKLFCRFKTANCSIRSCTIVRDFSTERSLYLVKTDDVSPQVRNVNKNIHIAVCIERPPVLTRSKTTLELEYEALQEMLEFEHSSLSDYEIGREAMATKRSQLKNDEDNEKLKKEVALLESEYQELRDIEEQHIKDLLLASRTTEADKTNDKSTHHRKLEEPLFLVRRDESKQGGWQLPHGIVADTETLRQAAERIVTQNAPGETTVHFLSNAPAGVYRKPEKDGLIGSAKVFFYQARLLRTVDKQSKENWSNCMWLTKEELETYLPSNYYKSLSKCIL